MALQAAMSVKGVVPGCSQTVKQQSGTAAVIPAERKSKIKLICYHYQNKPLPFRAPYMDSGGQRQMIRGRHEAGMTAALLYWLQLCIIFH
jgi:hypothetical protein